MPIEVAHINRASTRGMGQKSSDALTISLCKAHHRESHRGGKSFELKYRIDLLVVARMFFQRSPHKHRLSDPWINPDRDEPAKKNAAHKSQHAAAPFERLSEVVAGIDGSSLTSSSRHR